MALDKDLVEELSIPIDSGDEEVSLAITALLTSAIHDEKPIKTLLQLYEFITKYEISGYLDPLHSLPLLLQTTDPSARDLISLLAAHSSAKEVVMSVQEAVEMIERSIVEGDSDMDETAPHEQTTRNPPVPQVITLIKALSAAIPRLILKKKPASDIIKPLFRELGNIIDLLSSQVSKNDGRTLLMDIIQLATKVQQWNEQVNHSNNEDRERCQIILIKTLNDGISSCEPCIQSNIAQRTLEKCYPRLALRSQVESDWEDGDRVALNLLVFMETLGLHSNGSLSEYPTVDLMFSAYKPSINLEAHKVLSRLLPVLMSCLHTNNFLDESLAVLINTLYTYSTKENKTRLSDDVILPLCGLLPSVASAHPNPLVRHQAFRVLSLLLSSCDHQTRFYQLIELTKDVQYPQLRTASVGLVKEALLNALSRPTNDNPFCGPLFLRNFGHILFRSNPPDLLTSDLTLEEFEESRESTRLVECLALFYILLQRDVKNVTGIRDKDVVKSVQNNLLVPLERNLELWTVGSSVSNNQLHDATTIASLKIGLERIDSARSLLNL